MVRFKNYGKTPAYIVKMYKEKEMAQLMETERKRAVKPPFRYLPESERNEMLNVRTRPISSDYYLFFIFRVILCASLFLAFALCACTATKSTPSSPIFIYVFFTQGLKTNWAELHKEFLLLPMLTDTVPKMKRKTMLEKQLNDLEKDIDLLERNPSIYVCQDA